MPQLFQGIRILDWTQFQNGSAAGYMLGDLGAEVIHIERPGVGDATRGLTSMFSASTVLPSGHNLGFEMVNRNKKGITLDFSKPKGLEVLCRLVAKSDVFLTNFRRNVARKLKADYDSLRQYNPRLVYCHASLLGGRGPDSDTRGFDPIGQARSGIMFYMGDRDCDEPLQAPGGNGDQISATLCAWGITAALFGRERFGIGQEIEASILGGWIHQQFGNMNATLMTGRPMARHSRRRARNPLSNMYRCGDGKWICMSEPQSDRFWHPFCQALEIQAVADAPRFATARARIENSAELVAMLDRQFAVQPRDYWMARLREHASDIACDVINTLPDLVADPQVIANEYIVEFEHQSLGRVKTVAHPVRYSETPARIFRGAPEFGQHTEEILLEVAGYSWDEIEQLRKEEII